MPLVSAKLLGAGYDDEQRALEVVYRDGTVHRFEDVPPNVWADFGCAESQSEFVVERLADRYAVSIFPLLN